MSDNKDQNRDKKDAEDDQIAAYELNEIDSLLATEDPNFLKKISETKISASAVNLSVMNEAFEAVAQAEITIKDQIKVVLNYSKNPKNFVTFWSIFLACIVLIAGTWGLRKNFLQQKLFLTSFAELVDTVRDYNPITEVELFYDNPKFSKNIMTLSRMLINLQASENSGTNPMLALEVTVEGLSADAIIEIKDREAEFKDLLLRYTEEKSYDDLSTTTGKQNLCDQYRQVINSHLTRGQVRKVLLNSFIIKP